MSGRDLRVHTSYIGLGSNLKQPTRQLTSALQSLAQLPQCRLRAWSCFYRSHAVGPGIQPDYINAAAQLDTDLEPSQLLGQLHAIEQRQGRQRLERWGPRTLDLDLLLFDQLILDTPRLTLPHPRLQLRAFVLLPLDEICPRLELPNGSTVAGLLAGIDTSGVAFHCRAPGIEIPGNSSQT